MWSLATQDLLLEEIGRSVKPPQASFKGCRRRTEGYKLETAEDSNPLVSASAWKAGKTYRIATDP